jgi:hypothetical protein
MPLNFPRLRPLALGLVAMAVAACSSPTVNECKELPVAECATASGHTVFYADRDTDGFGDASDAKCLCRPAAPYTSTAPGDTKDSDPNIKPNAEDKCDGVDNDGDGETDEGYFVVDNGQVKAVGAACGVGACAGGTVVCSNDGKSARCDTASKATAESCNNIDDDCDGTVDEELTNVDASTCARAGLCASAGGQVKARCSEGAWLCDYSAVSGYVAGAEQSCDGIDENCDGVADDGFADTDQDGIADCIDNCNGVANPDQLDTDGDGVGNACDICQSQANSDQADTDIYSVHYTHARDVGLTESDCIEPGVVCLSRATTGGPVYNTFDNTTDLSGSDLRNLNSQTIEWACGTCEAPTSAFVGTLSGLRTICQNFGPMPNIVGQDTCLHIKGSGARWTIHWLGWSRDNNEPGAFEYIRSQPSPDNVPNACDNCPGVPNADQVDSDQDGVGDACDNCPNDPNADQADFNGDGVGDVCGDADGDTVLDAVDNCRSVENEDQADGDQDGVGDVCDNCATTANTDQLDSEKGPIVTFVKSDFGVEQDCLAPGVCLTRGNIWAIYNAAPAAEWQQFAYACGACEDESSTWYVVDDANQDTANNRWHKVRDSCLGGSDGARAGFRGGRVCLRTGTLAEHYRYTNIEMQDWTTNGAGGGFAYKRWGKSDGVGDVCDNCPSVPNVNQADFNGDGVGDACGDADGDTVIDALDNCPSTPNADQLDSERGPTVTFTKSDNGTEQDCLAPGVCLTRDTSHAIYNAAPSAEWQQFAYACGACEDEPSTWYVVNNANQGTADDRWRNVRDNCLGGSDGASIGFRGGRLCLRTGTLEEDHRYMNIEMRGWTTNGNGGGFAYNRWNKTDGIGDACDVCPNVVDPNQVDTDGDGIGDLCTP